MTSHATPFSEPNDRQTAGDASGTDRAADHDLLRRILEGNDEAAFGDLVARYSERAYWIAWHVVGSTEEARDIVQEAFVRVHRSLERFDFAHSFTTWFHRIVTNLAIDSVRRRRVARTVPIEACADIEAEDGDPEESMHRADTRGRVWQVLANLDEKFKTVLVLRDIHGLSCREIVPILGVTHATVRWRLHRGRQLFREEWERLERVDHRRVGLSRGGESALGEVESA
jgi:RNA polymerase sigma-70 factor (ECF subfamily)